MNILLCAATTFELSPTLQWLERHAKKQDFSTFKIESHTLQILVTGPGLVQSTFALTKILQMQSFDLVAQIGVAGSYRRDDALGQSVQVVEEQFADIGIQEADGGWQDLFQLGLVSMDQYPFKNGRLSPAPESPIHPSLPHRRGITVATVTGTGQRRQELSVRFNADIETMEGAALFYTALMQHTPCIQLRGISNYVEARQRANWRLDAAIDSVNAAFQEWLQEV